MDKGQAEVASGGYRSDVADDLDLHGRCTILRAVVAQLAVRVRAPGPDRAAGESHSLAVREDGSLLAWGANSAGQVGNGSTVNALSPVAVAGVDSVTSLDGGVAHSVATTADGEVWGWGQGVRGQLDRGGTTPSLTPAIIASELGTVTLVTSGDYHVLALEEVP